MLIYKRRPSPLHAARSTVGALWGAAVLLAILLAEDPLLLLAIGVALAGAAVGAGMAGELRGLLVPAAAVAIPMVLINVLVSRHGLTVFARLGDLGPFGQGDLTVEALVYGCVIAAKVVLMGFTFALLTLTVDPDRLLGSLRRLSFRSALTASLATRMMAVLAADAQRIAEAQRTRPGDHFGGARGRLALLSAVVGSSLDRSMDVAATLELRGFACGRRPARHRLPVSRHDMAFTLSACATIALAAVVRLTGLASFTAYPLLRWSVGAPTLALCAGLVAVLLLPFWDRRGVEP